MLIQKGGALVLGAGLVMFTTGCPLLEVSLEAEVKDVCLTYPDLEVPASDGTGSLSHHIVFDDVQSIEGIDQLDGNVEFTHVVLRAKSGVADFSFLESARIEVASGDPGSTLPELSIVDCAGADCASEGAEMTLFSGSPVDALAYLRSSAVEIGIEVTGALPTTAWTMDVDVCVRGKIRISQSL